MSKQIQDIYKFDEIKRKAILTCGSESLAVKLEEDYPSAGVWDPKSIIVPHLICAEIEIPHVTLAVNSVTSAVQMETLGVASKHFGLSSVWIEKNDPFTQENLLNNEENEVLNLISLFSRLLFINYREMIVNRLYALYNDSKEEEPDSSGITLSSLSNFYNFFQLYTYLKCPIITLTPDNNIFASWKGEQNRLFSLHFLPTGDVNFVIFKPNDRHPEKQVRISGTATTDVLMETIASKVLLDWIIE